MDAGEVPSFVFASRSWNERLFPSVRKRPGCSLELGMSALKSDLHMMSFIAKWRLAHAPDCLQTSPWWPLGSVVSPHWHWCGAQRFGPGGGQLPLGLLHYLVLNRKKQLELSKANHWHGVPIPLVILLGRVHRCSWTKPESYQLQSKGRPKSSAW